MISDLMLVKVYLVLLFVTEKDDGAIQVFKCNWISRVLKKTIHTSKCEVKSSV